jgi:hypothetical protein
MTALKSRPYGRSCAHHGLGRARHTMISSDGGGWVEQTAAQ